MVVIEDVIISDEIFERKFQCNLSKCKGACCWEGDYGAPVKKDEIDIIRQDLEGIQPYLPAVSREYLQTSDPFSYYKEPGVWGTYCHEDGKCIFLTIDNNGIAQCGIEKAWFDGVSRIKKPISCHLYPIRVTLNEISGFEAWNYDDWDICRDACNLGKSNKIPVFRFVKDAIIRSKGISFYHQMEEYYQQIYPD
jgi:hypothetical protein